jgi:hypothetical protein
VRLVNPTSLPVTLRHVDSIDVRDHRWIDVRFHKVRWWQRGRVSAVQAMRSYVEIRRGRVLMYSGLIRSIHYTFSTGEVVLHGETDTGRKF